MEFKKTKEFAKEMDKSDRVIRNKNKFYTSEDEIYMDGNSLGLMSEESEKTIKRVLNEWRELKISGWTDAKKPWFFYSEKLSEKMAPIMGAKKDEITIHSSTTLNIHCLISSLYKPKKGKDKILVENLNFPTDYYAIKSFLNTKGYSPDKYLKIVKSDDGNLIDEQKIIDSFTDDVYLALLPSVLYRSGQLLDIERLTKEAHKKDIIIGFDCSHSAGLVNHKLSENNVDFAMWSTYKYLNSGPGGAAGLYLNQRHFGIKPGLAGWFGSNRKKQFDLENSLTPSKNAKVLEVGTPNLLSMAPLEGSLNIFNEIGIENIHQKSKRITSYLMYLINEYLNEYNFQIITPENPDKRGGHVAIKHKEAARINEALKDKGIIPDYRRPNIIRLAPVPLYISYFEVYKMVITLKEIMDSKYYTKFENKRGVVS
ncbi:MAG: kynureninase [Bacillota bacterium]